MTSKDSSRAVRAVVLGSTGSVGRSAMAVAASLGGRIEIVGIAAGRNAALAARQAVACGCRRLAMADEAAAREAASLLAGAGIAVSGGADAAAELAADADADVVLCAISGMAAFRPVLAAIDAGRRLALASKEVLVAAGGLVLERARSKRVPIVPVDSEHSAIFQALAAAGEIPACVRAPGAPSGGGAVSRLWLTASGGPFYFRRDFDPEAVRPEDALAHPRWKMGPKVSVDSSTMMNKGFEILEARWLFDVPAERVGVLVHPESVVHSLVETADGAQLAQLAAPDMRLPVQYALTWPERVPNPSLPRLDLARAGTLRFEAPDERRFPCLALAREADRRGGVAPAAMNAADEAAVAAFLAGSLRWADIPRVVEAAIVRAPSVPSPTVADILAADAEARAFADSFARRV